jgi:diaminohydroxyphosphoribosylaminopyrimidine deaminase/5-amino-6-(5-phosphoribosylamino)uracil reductase
VTPAAREALMAQALAEARKGLGHTSPNPSVGALLVKDGAVVSSGHTAPIGGPHAEVQALAALGGPATGLDLFTTLEPCNHTGRTPPCTEAILKAGIRRVFLGARDPNPRAKGGVERLRAAGVEVVEGVQLAACEALHAPFFKHVATGLPWVTLKVASTLDGSLAAASGDSRWVTGPEARARVHALRGEVDAVLVGAQTARLDDPELTNRLPGATRQPLRVVVEGRTPLPTALRLFRDRAAPTLAVLAAPPSREREDLFATQKVEWAVVPGPDGRPELESVLRLLGDRGALHVLAEGGATVATGLLAGGLADALWLFLAPKVLLGGQKWLQGAPSRAMAEARTLTQVETELLGPDLLVRGRLR